MLEHETRLYTDSIGPQDPPLENINHERINQLDKWGQQTHTLPGWGNILAEEHGEVQKAICDYCVVDGGGTKGHLMHELVQLMTVATNIYIMLERDD